MTSDKLEHKKVFCFDTSALVTLSRTHENIIHLPDALWELLSEMFEKGEVISHLLVFNEIDSKSKNPDFITKWVREKESGFIKKSDFQVTQVSKIVKAFPKLIDVSAEKEQADPWIIALAMEKCVSVDLFSSCECIVVSAEDPRSSVKIPAACKHFNVKHLTLREFFDEIGFKVDSLVSATT